VTSLFVLKNPDVRHLIFAEPNTEAGGYYNKLVKDMITTSIFEKYPQSATFKLPSAIINFVRALCPEANTVILFDLEAISENNSKIHNKNDNTLKLSKRLRLQKDTKLDFIEQVIQVDDHKSLVNYLGSLNTIKLPCRISETEQFFILEIEAVGFKEEDLENSNLKIESMIKNDGFFFVMIGMKQPSIRDKMSMICNTIDIGQVYCCTDKVCSSKLININFDSVIKTFDSGTLEIKWEKQTKKSKKIL